MEKKRGGGRGVVGPTTPPPLSFEVGQSNVYKGSRDKGQIVSIKNLQVRLLEGGRVSNLDNIWST